MATTVQPAAPTARGSRRTWWLGSLTIAWMCEECAVALSSAAQAKSPALLAFGSDSLVELISAGVVLSQYTPRLRIAPERAEKLAGTLLFILAGVVTAIACMGLLFRIQPDVSRSGMAITAAALLIMPTLSALKRREGRRTHDGALVADAAQSATCAYLAFLTLLGLALHAAFRVAWFDSGAALLAVPLLIKEARAARRGEGCACAHGHSHV